MKQYKYNLSFPCDFITWDGRMLYRETTANIAAKLQMLQSKNVCSVMTGSIQFIEKADFDMAEWVREFSAMLRVRQMTVSSIHLVQKNMEEPGKSQSHIRQIMQQTVEVCALLRPEALVIHPALKISGQSAREDYTLFELWCQRHGRDTVMATMAANLAYMADAAARYGINLALENLGRFEAAADMRALSELIALANKENLGYCMDSGHAHVFGEDCGQWIKMMGKKLFATHFHDNHGRPAGQPDQGFVPSSPDSDEHLFPDLGTVDWPQIIRALQRVNYRHSIGFEVNIKNSEEILRVQTFWNTLTQNQKGNDISCVI